MKNNAYSVTIIQLPEGIIVDGYMKYDVKSDRAGIPKRFLGNAKEVICISKQTGYARKFKMEKEVL